MNKKKLMLPIMLVASSFFAQAQKDGTPPPPEPPKVEMVKFTPPKIVEDFYTRNTDVSSLSWQNGNIVTVYLKSKVQEKYDLNNSAQKKAFENKYGDCPPAPPPPPPAPPKVKAVKSPPPPPVPAKMS